jgi:hypothetical protein
MDPALASGATCETVPEAGGAAESGPWWATLPEHTHIVLQGYLLADTFHKPQVYAYPGAGLEAVNPWAAEVASSLGTFLETRPDAPTEEIPFLPPFNAAQIIRTQVRYVDFAGGTGVRFLTLYGQSFRVINNREMFYTFQGLTLDGSTYLAVILPTSHPSLPALGDVPPEEIETFAESFEAYARGIEADLEAEAPRSFTPDLAGLDAMMASFVID